MRKALPNFAVAKFLDMILLAAFRQYCQEWLEYDRREKKWTDDEVKQVEEVLIAQVNRIYGSCSENATVADAIKLPKQTFTDLGPDLDRAIELFENFLEYNGCWLKGELANRDFWWLIGQWHTPERMKALGLSGVAASLSRSGIQSGLRSELDHDPTIGEFGQLTSEAKAQDFDGVGLSGIKVLNAFRKDCGYPPLK